MPTEPLILRLLWLLLCLPDTCAGKLDFCFLIAAMMNHFETLEVFFFSPAFIHRTARIRFKHLLFLV